LSSRFPSVLFSSSVSTDAGNDIWSTAPFAVQHALNVLADWLLTPSSFPSQNKGAWPLYPAHHGEP
jgi:hypothetical protein